MQSSLLRTKLKVPPAPPHLVARDRLLDALDLGIPACTIALVCAPAGYGKTTLISQWARRTDLRVGWLTVDSGDNEVERFLRYLYAAWEQAEPDIRSTALGLLFDGVMPEREAVLSAFVNVAEGRGDHMALVIDDYHLVTEPSIHDALTFLIDHLPETLTFVITSREEPPLSLSRYRARQQLIELGQGDLRALTEEAEAFLNDAHGLGLSSDVIATLQARTEGWFAGLQLASLTLRADDRSHVAISGRHRFVADFLRDDVLAQLPDETRHFLVQTSIVDRLCGPLCDAITMRGDGQKTLERIERQNLFTMPLDDTREWFRYHRLFADLLRDELRRRPPDEQDALHRRAAIWFLSQDMPDPAFDHALAANDIGLVVEVVDAHMRVKLFSGQVATLLQWLRAIPDEWLEREPLLTLFQAAVTMVTGQFDACVRCLDDAEQAIRSAEQAMPGTMARVTAMRCFVACFSNDLARAESFAEVALDTLAPADESYRGDVHGALGDTYRRNGHWRQAHEHYLLALEHSDNPGGFVQAVHAFGALADLDLRQGKLHTAASYWRKALARIGDQRLWGTYPLPLIGWVHIRLGEILYEWNDLETAQDYATRGRERAVLGGDPRSMIAGGLLTTRLHLARGELDAAEEVVEQIRPTVVEAQFSEWNSEFERCQVELWLAQGKLRTAVTWSDEALARDPGSLPDQEPVLLAVTRVLIVKGDATSIEHALTLLQPLGETAGATGRIGLQIAALALHAMGLWRRGEQTDALSAVEHALRLAEPEGYARAFVDLGVPMARVLQEARRRKVMPAYVDRLLDGYAQDDLGRLPADKRLAEPLSERELDVLRKIAAGLTNREIADLLFISPETVKKHSGNIYGKLGARGRTEAVARARTLELLD